MQKAQPELVALFVSDVHLQPALPRTTQAFFNFLHRHAMHAQQLYLLGDMFEYWAGDDDIADPYNRQVADALRAVSMAGVRISWIAGNRDFLVSEEFAKTTGIVLLPDPFVAEIAGQRITLAHGDAQCTNDTAYMAFRSQVREQDWQRQFLSMPLAQRKAIIANLRAGSQEAQRMKPSDIMDVNPDAIASLFAITGTSLMIHGHTHRPARHHYSDEGKSLTRFVLPDWDCESDPPRGGWLAIDARGAIREFGVDGVER